MNLDKESGARERRRSIGKSDTFDMWGAVGLIRDDERRDNTERKISAFHSRLWHVCRHNPYIGIMILPYRHSPSVRSVAGNG